MTNPFDLNGHVAVVTGGNGGIGLGIARSLTRAGATVAIWGRDEAKCSDAVAELNQLGGADATYLVCDVSDESSVDEAMATTMERLGHLDSCFANAGVPAETARFTDAELDDWRRVLATNLDGAFLTLRSAARTLVDQGTGGSVVVTSSLTILQGAVRNEAYAASKSGLTGLVKALAVELGPKGIRANGIVPGWIETDLNRELLASDVFEERVLSRVPTRRWGTPDDIGGLAVYLASDASTYHTGDMLVVDGGFRLS